MPDKPHIVHEKVISRTQVFTVESLQLKFANGQERVYERLKTGRGAVIMVPMLDSDTVLLVREYAVGLHHYELGLAKGLIEVGEEPAHAANRELMEEVGYRAGKITLLTTFSLAPGYMNHQTMVFLVEELSPSKLPGDEPEPIEVVPWSINQLPELFVRKDITEARSIAALFWARDYMQNR